MFRGRTRGLTILAAVMLMLGILAAPGPAAAEPEPAFSVETPFFVWGEGDGWVEGRTVTITVDNDENPDNGILFSDSAEIQPWGWEFWLEDLGEIEPGNYVTADDGVEITKQLLVADLEVLEIDEDQETVMGFAPPFEAVDVAAWNEFGEAYRTVEADGGGFWEADFANPGDEAHEGDVLDIVIDTGGEAQVFDDDGDSTYREWYLEPPAEPNFFVRPDGDQMWGHEWFGGDEVTVTIDDDDDPATVLHEFTFEIYDGEFMIENIDFDILPGHYVVVTDGESTKSHWVTELMVTEVDALADLVHGTAEPGAEVFVGTSTPGVAWEFLNFQFGPDNRNPDSLNEYIEFRQAVAHAIDKDLLAEAIPKAAYSLDSYVDAYLPDLSQRAWAQYPYDPAAAATLVDSLCADLGRDCVANPPVAMLSTTAGNDTRAQMTELLVPMLGAAGIELQVELEDFFFDSVFERTGDLTSFALVGSNRLDWLVGAHWTVDPEERFDFNFNSWGTPGSSQVNAATARMAELVGLMDASDDRGELAEYVAEAESILADQLVFIPLFAWDGGVWSDEPFEPEGPFRIVNADLDGNWTADFSAPWEDQDPLDLLPGMGGFAEESDEDGDATHAGWAVPSPLQLKEQASGILSELIDSGELPWWSRGLVSRAARSLDASLQGWRWVDDYRLDPNGGSGVFWYERRATLSLDVAGRLLAKFGYDVPELQKVIAVMVSADRTLALTAITDADRAGGDAADLEKAWSYFHSGDGYAADGREAKAIKKYQKAWEWALRSLD
ncbi:MAG: ABC transporter substrate-binding protein [Acidimicrobiia bacterium]|nr:ABC transporter substrate-binding protein [Acidimicrobiia bacterium]